MNAQDPEDPVFTFQQNSIREVFQAAGQAAFFCNHPVNAAYMVYINQEKFHE